MWEKKPPLLASPALPFTPTLATFYSFVSRLLNTLTRARHGVGLIYRDDHIGPVNTLMGIGVWGVVPGRG